MSPLKVAMGKAYFHFPNSVFPFCLLGL
uniref:Uncharacterized protein n=1 Tax=Arundo donax TaxID=35708 RepID=A0A0A9EEQ9_ARUDO